ncbi:MAG: chemotaxis protein CheW [Gammaproteobacteria bacterium]|nr:chemotaxis protein CheW [Gammaproteobacteria bacterium]
MALANSNFVIFKIGPVPCCVDANSVYLVIEPPAHITAIPGSNSYRPGLFTHTKRAVAVYDVRTKFNLPTGQRGKILIAEINNRLLGFWVDSIQEIISSNQGTWQPLPAECPRELFDGVLLYKSQLVFKTGFEALSNAQVNTRAHLFINQFINESTHADVTTSKQSVTQNPPVLSNSAKPTEHVRNEPTHSKITTGSKAVTAKLQPTTKTSRQLTDRSLNMTTKSRPVLLQKTKTQDHTPTIKHNTHKHTTTPSKAVYSPSAITKTPVPATPKNDSARLINTQTNVKVPANYLSGTVRQDKTNESNQSSGWFTIFLVLTLIIATPLTGYYIFFQTPSTASRYQSKTALQHNTLPASRAADTGLSPPVTDQTLSRHEAVDLTDADTTTPASNSIEALEDTAINQATHDAAITPTKNTITIIIDDPDAKLEFTPPEADKKPSLMTAQIKETADVVYTIKPVEKNTNEEKPLAAKAKNTSRQVTHIVVKGDTLWHIAKRYIRDPLKYKQLAHLSNIKNPDLIYPGNRIIIIVKSSKKTTQ